MEQPQDPRLVTLANLGDGAAEEVFAEALRQVLNNIDDPNTDGEARRTIVLRIDVVPSADHRDATLYVGATTKLSGRRPYSTRVLLGQHNGEFVAANPLTQSEMFPKPTGRPAAVEREA